MVKENKQMQFAEYRKDTKQRLLDNQMNTLCTFWLT